jgi:thymidylate kinase
MTAPLPRIVAIDGHDGAGKSTIAALLAERLGGRTVRPFAPPVGSILSSLRNRGQLKAAEETAFKEISKLTAEAGSDLLIFDRHWASLQTMLSMFEPYKLSERWYPLPPTILVWTDVHTTRERHLQRGEKPFPRDRDEYYCKSFRQLAADCGLPILDTTNREPIEVVASILSEWCFPGSNTPGGAK